jgi:hypothetical protein
MIKIIPPQPSSSFSINKVLSSQWVVLAQPQPPSVPVSLQQQKHQQPHSFHKTHYTTTGTSHDNYEPTARPTITATTTTTNIPSSSSVLANQAIRDLEQNSVVASSSLSLSSSPPPMEKRTVLSDVEEMKEEDEDGDVIHLDHDETTDVEQTSDGSHLEQNHTTITTNTTSTSTTGTGTTSHSVPQMNSTSQSTSPDTSTSSSTTTTSELQPNDVIVVAFVDGTMMGLSRFTGQTLWRMNPTTTLTSTHQPDSIPPQPHQPKGRLSNHPLLQPLVATTTTIGGGGAAAAADTARSGTSSKVHRYPYRKTVAVPSILDGKVYLTSTTEDCRDTDTTTTSDVCDIVEDTVTTTIQNLLQRTPFVDNEEHHLPGRIYTSQRQSIAVAIQITTGIPIRTITTTPSSTNRKFDPSSNLPMDPMLAIRETISNVDASTTGTTNEVDLLWIGRTDSTISVHNPQTGELEVQFTMAEMNSLQEILFHDSEAKTRDPPITNPLQSRHETQQKMRQYLLPHTTSTTLGDEENDNLPPPVKHVTAASSRLSSSAVTQFGLIATPNGHVAYRNLFTGQILWVMPPDQTWTNTPAVYAFDANTKRAIPVEIVPDAISPHGTLEYVSNTLQQQLYERHDFTTNRPNHYHHPYESMHEPVFGSLPGTGQIYAIPLLQKVSSSTTTTTALNRVTPMYDTYDYVNDPKKLEWEGARSDHIPDIARAYVKHNSYSQYDPNLSPQHQTSTVCHPNNPLYPNCVTHGNKFGGHDQYYKPNHQTQHHQRGRTTFPNTISNAASFHRPMNIDDDTTDADDMIESGAIVPFYHPDYGYQYIPPNHFYTLHTNEWKQENRRRKQYRKIRRILTSWFLPTVVAAIFVMVRND